MLAMHLATLNLQLILIQPQCEIINRMVERRSYWNNNESGCHIEIDRSQNTYEADVHTMTRFL